MINHAYITHLIEQAKNHLEKSYNYTPIKFDNFELINAFLIDKTLNQTEYSLFIKTPDIETKRDFYFPVLLSVAATLFSKNYIDDKTIYCVGDIVQEKRGKRYKIVDFKNDRYTLKNHDEFNTTLTRDKKSIKNFIVTTANLSTKQSRAKFDEYRKLFKLLFNVDYFPSKFAYKTALILEKKDLLDIIDDEEFEGINLSKALPFKWVTRQGMKKNEAEHIPIEPMIYLAPDYETFKEHIIEKIDNLDSVIFIGKNKYEPFLRKIKKDIRQNIIPNAIFIGRSEIDDFQNLSYWRWTFPETNFFDNIKCGTVNHIKISEIEFLKRIKNFEDYIISLDEQFNFELKLLFRFNKFLYSLVLPDNKSRLNTQIEYVKHLFKKETESSISESFFNINQNPHEYLINSEKLIDNIFNNLTYSKIDKLKNQKNADILIVPERFKDSWQNEIEIIKLNMYHLRNLKVQTIKEFKQTNYSTKKEVYLLTLFGFQLAPLELLRELLKSSHNINFILYSEEEELAEKLIIRYENELIREYSSHDRFTISKVRFPLVEKDEGINDIINKFYEKGNFAEKNYDYEITEHVEYEIEFENGEIEVYEGNKTILLENGNQKNKAKISNLMLGDKIRIYENSSKEHLFNIAKREDTEGRFHEIIEQSKLWKRCLLNFYGDKIREYTFNSTKTIVYNSEQLLKELQNNGATIQLSTLEKWLVPNDSVLFPKATSNLIAIKQLISSNIFNESFNQIIKSKRNYISIMIALGRDLSDEIMDYIISNNIKKGKILEKFSEQQIESFIAASAPLRIIKNNKILESNNNE